jgi:hypothetical protein
MIIYQLCHGKKSYIPCIHNTSTNIYASDYCRTPNKQSFLAITWQGQITFNERKIILYSHFVVDPQAELDLYSTNFLLGCFFNPPPKFFSQKTFFFIAELSQRVMLCIQCLWTFTFNFSVKPQLIGDKLDRNCHFNKKKILIGNPIANRVFPYIF